MQMVFKRSREGDGDAVKAAKKYKPTYMKAKKRKVYKDGQEGPEIKYLDKESLNVGFSSIAAVYDCSLMAQGQTNTTRIGNKICVKSIHVRLNGESSIAADIQPNKHKWMLVYDKEPEPSALASYNQIMTSNDVIAFRNIGESDRFKVLAEGVFEVAGMDWVNTTGGAQPSNSSFYLDKFIPLDINIKYTGTGATQSNVATGQLLFTFISQTTDGNGTYDFRTRIRYTDE